MSDRSPEPSDDELVVFARTLLGDFGEGIDDRGLLYETVQDARHLWLLLYDLYADQKP